MVKIANILLILGIIVFVATSASFIYHFNQTGIPLISDSIGMTTSGAFSCFAIFMRRRLIQGIPIFEMTAKDKTQLQEVRRELNIWRLLARFLGGIGSLALIAGMMTLINIHSSGKFDWRVSAVLVGSGIALLLPAILLARRSDKSD